MFSYRYDVLSCMDIPITWRNCNQRSTIPDCVGWPVMGHWSEPWGFYELTRTIICNGIQWNITIIHYQHQSSWNYELTIITIIELWNITNPSIHGIDIHQAIFHVGKPGITLKWLTWISRRVSENHGGGGRNHRKQLMTNFFVEEIPLIRPLVLRW